MKKIFLLLFFFNFVLSQTLESKLLGHWDSPENKYYQQVEELTPEVADLIYKKIPSNIEFFKNGVTNVYFFNSKMMVGNWKLSLGENDNQVTLDIIYNNKTSQTFSVFFFNKEVFPLFIEEHKKIPNANKDLLKIIEKDFKGEYPGMFLKPENGITLLFQRIKKYD